MTRQKALILALVQEAKDHPTAQQIFLRAKERLPSLAMATVYNNLNALTREGLIRRITLQGQADRYDQATVHHDHLVCDRCGAVSDISLGSLLDALSSHSGQQLTGYELNLHYLCDKCRGNEYFNQTEESLWNSKDQKPKKI